MRCGRLPSRSDVNNQGESLVMGMIFSGLSTWTYGKPIRYGWSGSPKMSKRWKMLKNVWCSLTTDMLWSPNELSTFSTDVLMCRPKYSETGFNTQINRNSDFLPSKRNETPTRSYKYLQYLILSQVLSSKACFSAPHWVSLASYASRCRNGKTWAELRRSWHD